jgi:O-antigen ligase
VGAATYLVNDASLSISAWIDARVPTDASTLNGRLPLWHATVQNVLGEAVGTRELLFGHGFASFRYFGLSLFAYAGEAHNAALQVLYELGLVGLAVWTVAILVTFHQMWRSGAGLRERLFVALFCVYLIAIESADSSLADSRSFLLILILLYAHTPGAISKDAVARAKAPVRRWRMLSTEHRADQPAELAIRHTQ